MGGLRPPEDGIRPSWDLITTFGPPPNKLAVCPPPHKQVVCPASYVMFVPPHTYANRVLLFAVTFKVFQIERWKTALNVVFTLHHILDPAVLCGSWPEEAFPVMRQGKETRCTELFSVSTLVTNSYHWVRQPMYM